MISPADVKKLAVLARIKLSDDELAAVAHDMGAILDYVKSIQEVSATLPENPLGENRNVLREDANPYEPGIFTDAILAEAPRREGQYLKVKKIL